MLKFYADDGWEPEGASADAVDDDIDLPAFFARGSA